MACVAYNVSPVNVSVHREDNFLHSPPMHINSSPRIPRTPRRSTPKARLNQTYTVTRPYSPALREKAFLEKCDMPEWTFLVGDLSNIEAESPGRQYRPSIAVSATPPFAAAFNGIRTSTPMLPPNFELPSLEHLNLGPAESQEEEVEDGTLHTEIELKMPTKLSDEVGKVITKMKKLEIGPPTPKKTRATQQTFNQDGYKTRSGRIVKTPQRFRSEPYDIPSPLKQPAIAPSSPGTYITQYGRVSKLPERYQS